AGQQGDIEVLRDEPVPDALDAVMAPRATREQGALGGLDRVDRHTRIALAKIPADAGQRAAAALRVHERADRALHLLADLGRRRERVGLDVVRVVELPGHPVAMRLAGADLLEATQRQIHIALTAWREDQRRAVEAHDLLPLVAHAFGHHDRAR